MASPRWMRENTTGYLFVAPALVLIGLFGIFPVLFTVYVSFYRWRIRRDTFVGIENYARAFGELAPLLLLLAAIGLIALGFALARTARGRAAPRGRAMRVIGAILALGSGITALVFALPALYGVADKEMLDTLRVTIWYSAGAVPVQLAAGLVLAVLINRKLPGRQLFRVIYLLPYIVPAVASAAVFERLFSLRTESMANQILALLGAGPQQWLVEARGIFTLMTGGQYPTDPTGAVLTYWRTWAQGPSLALVSIMVYNWWVFIGYYALIYTNGLGAIPRQLYEAAEVDGAGRVRSFFRITIPLLSPTTYFLTLLGVIGTFKAFNHIYVLRTPAIRGAADPVSIYIFFTFFRQQRFGYAAALSLILFAIVVGLTVVQRRIAKRSVHYGD